MKRQTQAVYTALSFIPGEEREESHVHLIRNSTITTLIPYHHLIPASLTGPDNLHGRDGSNLVRLFVTHYDFMGAWTMYGGDFGRRKF